MNKVITYTEDQVLQIKYMLNGISVMGIQNAKQVAAIAQVLDLGMHGEIQEPEKPNKLKGFYSAADWANLPDQKTKISNKPEKKEGEG